VGGSRHRLEPPTGPGGRPAQANDLHPDLKSPGHATRVVDAAVVGGIGMPVPLDPRRLHAVRWFTVDYPFGWSGLWRSVNEFVSLLPNLSAQEIDR
jgi:hypothetical protein